MARKQRKETILAFSDIVKSFNVKVKHFDTIAEHMNKLPMIDKTICKTYNMDDPAKDLVVKCISCFVLFPRQSRQTVSVN